MGPTTKTEPPTKLFYIFFIVLFIFTGIAFAGMLANFANQPAGLHAHEKPLATNESVDTKLGIIKGDFTDLEKDVEDNTHDISLNKFQSVENKLNIKANHPTGPSFVPKPDPEKGEGDTPQLTITSDKSQYSQGESINFSGFGEPGKPVFITVLVGNNIRADKIATTADGLTGEYTVDYSTDLDAPLGSWQAWANVGKQKTDPIKFTIID